MFCATDKRGIKYIFILDIYVVEGKRMYNVYLGPSVES